MQLEKTKEIEATMILFCSRGEATEEENLEEMARTANPEEISIDEDDDDEDEKIEGEIFCDNVALN